MMCNENENKAMILVRCREKDWKTQILQMCLDRAILVKVTLMYLRSNVPDGLSLNAPA